MNKWPLSKELDNWCHFQFQVKDELNHTQGFYLPYTEDDRKQYPWLVGSGVRFRMVANLNVVFVEGFFAN